MMNAASAWFSGEETALSELLAARERRAAWQRRLRENHAGAMVVLSVLTPGAVKNHAFSRAVFHAGQAALARLIETRGWTVGAHIRLHEAQGEMACWIIHAAPHAVKHSLLHLEDSQPIGRLWDLDVLDEAGNPLSRREFHHAPRRCLVCDADAKICARERRHSLDELQTAMLARWQEQSYVMRLAANMRAALEQEALLTPKPALVDMQNHASHPDMPPEKLLASAAAIAPYFAAMAVAGMNHQGAPDAALLAAIRPIGQAAERAMFAATQGVNTHKGAVFAFGLWAAVLGWQYRHARGETHRHASAHIAAMCAGLHEELAALAARPPQTDDSAGVRLFREHGLGGARAQAASGFAAVFEHALPVFARESAQGDTQRGWLLALLALIAANDDTTTVSRGGTDALRWAQKEARRILNDARGMDAHALLRALLHFDEQAACRRLSFGGSADLLALAMFLHNFSSQEENHPTNSAFLQSYPMFPCAEAQVLPEVLCFPISEDYS